MSFDLKAKRLGSSQKTKSEEIVKRNVRVFYLTDSVYRGLYRSRTITKEPEVHHTTPKSF